MARRRILIVDDEDDIREITSIALETTGDYEVLLAADGEMGIVAAEAHAPDVILLDFMMPGLDGPSTYARLREMESTRAIPVIFLTAKTQKTDQAFLMNLGAHGVIAKPFDPMLLARQIEEILSW